MCIRDSPLVGPGLESDVTRCFFAHVVGTDVGCVACTAHRHTSLGCTLVRASLESDVAGTLLAHIVGADVSNMPDSTHAHARLGCALVLAGLQADDVLTGFELLLSELTDVLFSWLRSDGGSGETIALTLSHTCTLYM